MESSAKLKIFLIHSLSLLHSECNEVTKYDDEDTRLIDAKEYLCGLNVQRNALNKHNPKWTIKSR